jgi:hypothetical protein
MEVDYFESTQLIDLLARLERFELPTFWFVVVPDFFSWRIESTTWMARPPSAIRQDTPRLARALRSSVDNDRPIQVLAGAGTLAWNTSFTAISPRRNTAMPRNIGGTASNSFDIFALE